VITPGGESDTICRCERAYVDRGRAVCFQCMEAKVRGTQGTRMEGSRQLNWRREDEGGMAFELAGAREQNC
jgi:hypothetical protein